MVEHGTENAGVPSSILGLSTTLIDSEPGVSAGLFLLCVGAGRPDLFRPPAAEAYVAPTPSRGLSARKWPPRRIDQVCGVRRAMRDGWMVGLPGFEPRTDRL